MTDFLAPKTFGPLSPKQVQADGPHMAVTEIEMAWQANGQMNYAAPNTISSAFWDPTTAPVATMTSVGSFVDFYLPEIDTPTVYGWPWSIYPSCDTLGVMITLAMPNPKRVVVRAQTRTLVDSVTTKTSDPVQMQMVSPVHMPMWNNDFIAYKASTATLLFSSERPALPSSRRVFVVPQIRLAQNADDDITAGLDILAYIVSAIVFDRPKAELVP